MSRCTLDTAVGLPVSCTGLSPSPAGFPKTFLLPYLHHVMQSTTPRRILVWPLSLSLAATQEIDVSFSSCSYLDVSVQSVPLLKLFYSLKDNSAFHCQVSPFGNLRINDYVRLPEAYRSFLRPSSVLDAKAFSLCSY